MPHYAMYGTTESGKTTLGKAIARFEISRGYKVAVIGHHQQNWPCTYWTNRLDQLQEWSMMRENWGSFIFMDDCWQLVQQNRSLFGWFATDSSNYGQSCYFMAHRLMLVPPTVRTQASIIYVFNQGPTDAEFLAKEYRKPILETGQPLPKLVFYRAGRYKLCQRGCINWHTGYVPPLVDIDPVNGKALFAKGKRQCEKV